ncbi:MAG: hypothetical protein HY543_07595 [Deltaproteobacteria bacterium]|nr:hypothetical protein [Deltaproteobacteria bacterium]
MRLSRDLLVAACAIGLCIPACASQSRAAARRLGMIGSSVARVRIELAECEAEKQEN